VESPLSRPDSSPVQAVCCRVPAPQARPPAPAGSLRGSRPPCRGAP